MEIIKKAYTHGFQKVFVVGGAIVYSKELSYVIGTPIERRHADQSLSSIGRRYVNEPRNKLVRIQLDWIRFYFDWCERWRAWRSFR